MITNKVMIREMGEFEIKQRTIDSMFNATDLIRQWNQFNDLKRGKEVNGFLKIGSTKDFIETISSKENLHTNKIVSKSRASRGHKSGTWMHPLLFIDFAMWINPEFKYEVLKFVHDQLIESRHIAGDNYKTLSSSGSKIKDYDYREVAKALNWIVFGKHDKNLRQTATQEELTELSDLEKNLTFAIDMGLIKSQDQLMKHLRSIWNNKNLAF